MLGQPSAWVVGLFLLLLGFSAHALPLVAEKTYRTAETAQFELESFDRIANQLGFASLGQYEDSKLKSLFNRALIAYFKVFEAKDPLWSSRAAYRIAELVAHFFEKQVFSYTPPYRYSRLPFSFAIHQKSSNQLPSIKNAAALQDEITLLYETIEKYAKKLNIDKELLKDLQKKLKSLSNQTWVQTEKIISPFKQLEREILRDHNGQIQQRQENGKWKTIAITDLKTIQTAIKNPSQTVRLSGLVIAELHPNNQFILPLLAQWKKPNRPLFNNLQNTLFGESERILLALKALIQKEPKSIELIVASSKLPAAEKAWLLSFANKNESTVRMAKELLNQEDALTASRALWVLYQANPKTALPIVRQHLKDRRSFVSTTSQRILEISQLSNKA